MDFKTSPTQTFETEGRVAYNRMDHDGKHWWNTWFPCRKVVLGEDKINEMDAVDSFIREKFPNGVSDIRKFINDGGNVTRNEDEGSCYIVGEHMNYWIRLIPRPGDYNCYISCYMK